MVPTLCCPAGVDCTSTAAKLAKERAKNGGNSQSVNGFHDCYTCADEFYSRVVSINLTIDR